MQRARYTVPLLFKHTSYVIGMEVLKIVFHCILEIFHSIQAYSIPKFLFHSIPCPVCRFYIIIIIVTFYPNDCSQFENPEAPDFEKILPLPAPFQRFRFRIQPLSSKCFRFHKKLIASTASASSFRFHIPNCMELMDFD